MVLTKFRAQVLVNVTLLVFFLAAGLYLIFRYESLFVGTVFLLISFGIVYRIFTVVNKTNYYLANFLMSIQYDDFEASYSRSNMEVSEKELMGAFNLISGKFRNIRLEKEIQFQYFQTLVENVDTGLIGFNKDGKTIFMNRSLQNMLHKSYFPEIRSIQKYDEELFSAMLQIKVGERKMVKKVIKDEVKQLAVQKVVLKIRDEPFEIYSFHNIHEELQEQELKSWQKLIRILTHEIMNSVTPVISLANSTNDIIEKHPVVNEELRKDIHQAIRAIQKRTEGLLHFTETYRTMTRIPPPQFHTVEATALMEGICYLMGSIIKDRGIDLEFQRPKETIFFQGDSEQLEQTLINLIKNALEALSNSVIKKIRISIEKREPSVLFRIADSGPGIPKEIRDQIFVPFFTTKPEGSGIGLSLCRHIIYQHGGSIRFYSPDQGGTEFIVSLPC